jgi:DNA (cytosine-5)-methyltransferase 1
VAKEKVLLQVLDLFSGIGGISYGLESAGGFCTVAFCEIDPFCREVLRNHWPEVPVYDDVRQLSSDSLLGRLGRVGSTVGSVDVIVGGFPCQPHSVAGKRKGRKDERHLWPEFARLVREIRPRWVLAENVPGLRTTAADEVLEDLEAAGYAAWPLVVGADDVGAPHRRKRIWIVAHRDGAGLPRTRAALERSDSWADRRDDAAGRGHRCGGPVGDSGSAGREERYPARLAGKAGHATGERVRWPARPGEPQHEWEEPRLAYAAGRPVPQTERERETPSSSGDGRDGGARSPKQPLGSAVDGVPERLVRAAERRARRANREALKAYGNSVVPQVVEAIGRAILEVETETEVVK